MADILRFDPLGPPTNPNWRRFPRFEEVGAQIDAQANRIFDTRASLTVAAMLYARVEQKLPAEDHGLLRDLYEAITLHHERYEHAAYLVGLRPAPAGSRASRRCSTTTELAGRPETRLDVGRPAILLERAPDLLRARQRRLPLRDVLAAVELVVEEKDQRRLGCAGNERRARPTTVGMPEPPQDSRFRVRRCHHDKSVIG